MPPAILPIVVCHGLSTPWFLVRILELVWNIVDLTATISDFNEVLSEN